MIDGTPQAAALARPAGSTGTVAALSDHLRALRELVARDCPSTVVTAGMRACVLLALDSAAVLATHLAALMPAEAEAVVEIPRVPRFGPGDAAGPDRGLAGGRPHP